MPLPVDCDLTSLAFVIPQLAQVHFIMVRPFLVLTYRSLPGTHSVCFFSLTQYDFTIIYKLYIFEVIDDESLIIHCVMYIEHI